jgi:hypothetical protein
METKPYSLQSPEQIAKDYGGNKQKIAEAMQMGVIDPTAGTLAGMFIDRMRSAAQTEAAPQQSVAQQVFAPPMPPMPQGMPPMPQMPQGAPAGLGATPQAAAMPAPAAAPPMGMPTEQPMPGMAAGGLAALPIPDDMFDEPTNGGFNDGYRGGGLVAFSDGTGPGGVKAKTSPDTVDPKGIVVTETREKEEVEIPEAKPIYKQGTTYLMPEDYTPFAKDIPGNINIVDREAPLEVKRAKQYQAYLDRMLSPEEQKARRREDMFMALGQIGARMASTPGSLLQAASAGIGEALPGVAAAAKERRAEERAAQQALVGEERIGNKEREARLGVALDMASKFDSAKQAFESENFRNTLAYAGIDADMVNARVMAGANIQNAIIQAAASRFNTITGLQSERERRGTQAAASAIEYLKTPQGLAAMTAARKAGTSDADFIRSLTSAFGGGNVTQYDSKGNPI